MKFGTGQSIKRREDVRFVTGHGEYTDDIVLPSMLHGAVLRSPYPHAAVKSIDVAAAKAASGVVAVYTAKDFEGDKLGAMGFSGELPGGPKPVPTAEAPQPVLATDKVRYVGMPVAFVVAETDRQARDAAELIEVDYEPIDAVGTISEALRAGAPAIWESAPDNICFDWATGDEAATKAGFEKAAFIAEVTAHQNRIVPNSMEPRGSIGEYDAAEDRYILRTGNQGAHSHRGRIASTLGVEADKVLVLTPDVGGGFGMKGFVYPESILTLVAAKRLGRPVKWYSDRSEAFQADCHGRAVEGKTRVALDKDGNILAVDIDNYADLGAFKHQFGPFIATMAGARVWGGLYRIPAFHARVRGVFTNAMAVDAYRGAGRPEASYMIERLMTEAGRLTGLGDVEIRKRNFIRPTDLPYKTWIGTVVDSGEFATVLDRGLEQADVAGFEARKAASKKNGKLRGLGISYYVEIAASGEDWVEVRFTDNGGAILWVGTQSNGQGHETTFAQLLSEELGIPYESIEVRQGNSDATPMGGGTGGSRSANVVAAGTRLASEAVIEKGKKVAAHMLDTSPDDISFDKSGEWGLFRAGGSNQTVSLPEVAIAARSASLPEELKQELGEGGLNAHGHQTNRAPTLPNGCHVCEVEIDEATGETKVVSYSVLDDFGFVINPMIVEGQVHGGIAQGIGQAIVEDCVYDPESGQLMTGSFMDYGMPRADDIPPEIKFATQNYPTPSNPFGLKGCGEAGTVGALGAVSNAIVNALREYGVSDFPMPATPEKVWRMMGEGRAA